mmetsp:Transcript_34435/g.77844  ORF Transcript_34435/g.77844 Transcript_34435/m.77844 type:complete len:524 (+) Transcript_34435:73-1644(+)
MAFCCRSAHLAMLCIALVGLLCRLWQERLRIRRPWQRLLQCLASLAMPPGDDPLERRVREECANKRLERARGMSLAMNVFSVLRMAFTAVAYEQPQEMIGFYVFAVFSAAVSSWPKAVTPKTLDLIYVVGMLCLIIPCLAHALGVEWFEDWFYKTSQNINSSMVFCMSLLNLRVRLNLLFALAFVVPLCLQPNGPSLTASLRSVLFLAVILIWLDHNCERGVRLELRAWDSSSQLSAVRGLLSSICDATVDMDWGLRITEHSPQLAGLLFQNPVSSLMGRTLQEFMPERADRERFDQHMQGADEAAEHAAVFHTKLRDSVGGTIDMELFSVAFKGAGDRRRHVLGMREFTDIQPMTGLPHSAATPARQPKHACPPRNGPGTPASVEHCDLQSVSSSSSSSSASSLTSQASPKPTPTQIPTCAEAKMLTMSSLIQSWHVPPLSSDCCPWHVNINKGVEALTHLARLDCVQTHGRKTSWQCMRCGIKNGRYRQKKGSRGCKLCVDIPDDEFIQPEPVQTNVQMSL